MSRHQRWLGDPLYHNVKASMMTWRYTYNRFISFSKNMSLILLLKMVDKHRCNFFTSESALLNSNCTQSSSILPKTVLIYVRRLVTSTHTILILLPGFAPSKILPISLKQWFVGYDVFNLTKNINHNLFTRINRNSIFWHFHTTLDAISREEFPI